jgi:hypothetical protein
MRIEKFSFGHITIDGVTYQHDVVIDRGKVQKRVKKPSKKLRDAFAHTPRSAAEKIPWKCRRLVIGTGAYGNLPVTDDVKREAARRELKLVILPNRRGHRGAPEVFAAHERRPARDVLIRASGARPAWVSGQQGGSPARWPHPWLRPAVVGRSRCGLIAAFPVTFDS